MKKPLIVIGHRMGKGQKVAEGIMNVGCDAIVIEGMVADMKIGQYMHDNKADLGISFCGSGGAGAITAENQFGYKSTHHLRTVDAGVSAVRDGYQVLGFGFMDTVELGERIAKALLTRIGGE